MDNRKVHFPILLEQDEDGFFIVSCPSFKGCHSYGVTVEEAMKNIEEVIEMCMEEEKPQVLNRFIGFREIEMNVAV
ncbi:MAG TPA: type II toxin-antitoxin system HicB family antitoxin [Segetibacter sp.]|jgi:predicted RNase H-like HicB family nuclease